MEAKVACQNPTPMLLESEEDWPTFKELSSLQAEFFLCKINLQD